MLTHVGSMQVFENVRQKQNVLSSGAKEYKLGPCLSGQVSASPDFFLHGLPHPLISVHRFYCTSMEVPGKD